MGRPKPPKPADPRETGAAQTATNVATSVANTIGSQVNQITPDGSRTFKTIGYHNLVDPLSGKTHKIPIRQETVSLSPQQQAQKALLDRAEYNLAGLAADQSGKLRGFLDKPFNPQDLPERGDLSLFNNPDFQRVGGSVPTLADGAPSAPTLNGTIGEAGEVRDTFTTDFGLDRKRVEDALFDRLNPQLDNEREALEQRLADQGIRVGSQAYNDAFRVFNEGANDARTSVVLRGGEELSRLAGIAQSEAQFANNAQGQRFNQALTRAGFDDQQAANQFGLDTTAFNTRNAALDADFRNRLSATGFDNQAAQQELQNNQALFNAQEALRNSALEQEFALRNQPINEVTSLLSGSQIEAPTFNSVPFSPSATTNFAGIQAEADRAELAAFNAAQANNPLTSALGFGAKIAASLSDRRAKKDVRKIGKTDDGQNLYSFKYKGSDQTQVGLIAQEVKKTKPEAVMKLPGGLLAVDYDKALGHSRKGLMNV